MKNVFKLGMALLCMICYSLSINAQVKLNEKIWFYGKLDKKTNLPKKKNRTSMYVSTGASYPYSEFNLKNKVEGKSAWYITDQIEGDFEGDMVSNAVLTFPSDWKFCGTLKFEIDNTKKQIVYHFITGKLMPINRVLNNYGQYESHQLPSSFTYIIEEGTDAYIIRGFDGRLQFSDSILKFFVKGDITKYNSYGEFLKDYAEMSPMPFLGYVKYNYKSSEDCKNLFDTSLPVAKMSFCTVKFDEKFPHAIWNLKLDDYVETAEGITMKKDSIIWPNGDYLTSVYRGSITLEDGSKIISFDLKDNKCYEAILANGDTLIKRNAADYFPLIGEGDIHKRKITALSNMPKGDPFVSFSVHPKGGGKIIKYVRGEPEEVIKAREAAEEAAQEKAYNAGIKKLDQKYGGKASQLINTGKLQVGMKWAMFFDINDLTYPYINREFITIYHDGAEWENGGRYKINVKNNTIYGSTTYRVRVDNGAVSIIYR